MQSNHYQMFMGQSDLNPQSHRAVIIYSLDKAPTYKHTYILYWDSLAPCNYRGSSFEAVYMSRESIIKQMRYFQQTRKHYNSSGRLSLNVAAVSLNHTTFKSFVVRLRLLRPWVELINQKFHLICASLSSRTINLTFTLQQSSVPLDRFLLMLTQVRCLLFSNP